MRWLPKSATKTSPLVSTATPVVPLNCPWPVPALPHFVRNAPHMVVLVVDTTVVDVVLVEVALVLEVVETVVVVGEPPLGHPASVVGAIALLAILNTLLNKPLGALVR